MKDRQFGWLGLALAIAGGFLAGVLLVAILGGAQPVYKDRTLTVAARQAGTAVPALRGVRLDHALDSLSSVGLKADVQGGGLFGVVDESSWVVSGQNPSAGARLRPGDTVTLQIDHN